MPPQNQPIDRRKPLPQKPQPSGHHISNTEWILVIAGLFMIDGAQILFDLLFASGVIINRFIDIFVGMAFALYLQIRGGGLSLKQTIALALTFIGEEIPIVDAAPFWGLDGIYQMLRQREQEALAKIPGGKLVASAVMGRKVPSQIPPPLPSSGSRSLSPLPSPEPPPLRPTPPPPPRKNNIKNFADYSKRPDGRKNTLDLRSDVDNDIKKAA